MACSAIEAIALPIRSATSSSGRSFAEPVVRWNLFQRNGSRASGQTNSSSAGSRAAGRPDRLVELGHAVVDLHSVQPACARSASRAEWVDRTLRLHDVITAWTSAT